MSFERLEYFYLSFHLTFFDWLEDFDNNIGIIINRDASIDLRIFSLPYFVDNFKLLNISKDDYLDTHIKFHRLHSYSMTNPFAYLHQHNISVLLGAAYT